MRPFLAELVEPFLLVVYALLAGALTLAGLAIEYVGLTASGPTRLWVIFMGGVVLAFAVLILRNEVLPELGSRNA
jgi:hypothetical protein